MTPYVTQYICAEDLELFAMIRKAVERMGDLDLGLDEYGDEVILSCHILARAVAQVFPVSVRDGRFADIYDHSWVETRSGNPIDLYPVAVVGGPIMYDGCECSPQRRLFLRLSARRLSRGRFGTTSFRRAVRRTAKALRQAQNTGSSSRDDEPIPIFYPPTPALRRGRGRVF